MRQVILIRSTIATITILSIAMPTAIVRAQSSAMDIKPKSAEASQPTCDASKDEELSKNYTLCLTGASIAGCPLIAFAAALPLPFIRAEVKSKPAVAMVEKLTTLQKEAVKQQLDYFRLEQLRADKDRTIKARDEFHSQKNRLQAANDTTTESKEATARIRRASDFIDSADAPPSIANDNIRDSGNVQLLNRPTATTYYFQDQPIETFDTYTNRRISEIESEIQAVERRIDPRLKEKLETAKQNYRRAVESAGKWLSDTAIFPQTIGAEIADIQAEIAHLKLAVEQETLAKIERHRENYRYIMRNWPPAARNKVKAKHHAAGLGPKQISELLLEQRNRLTVAESNWHEALETRNRFVRDMPKASRQAIKKTAPLSLGFGAWGTLMASLDYTELYEHCDKGDLPEDLRKVVAFDEKCNPIIPMDERGTAYFELPKDIRNAIASKSKVLCAAIQNTNKKVQSDLKEHPEVDIDPKDGKCDITVKHKGREYHHVLVREGDGYNLMGSFIPGRRPAASRDMFAFRVQLNKDLESGAINSDNVNWSGGFRDRGKFTPREAIKTYHETPDPVIPNEQSAKSYTGIDPRAHVELMNSAGEQFTLMKSYLDRARVICALEHREAAAAQDKANGTQAAPRSKNSGSTDNP